MLACSFNFKIVTLYLASDDVQSDLNSTRLSTLEDRFSCNVADGELQFCNY